MDITGLHHVGHVVGDLTAALALYERLGFVVPPPSCPAMVRAEGGEPEPFGAANTHADFPASFVELAAPVVGGLPDDVKLIPLEGAPALVERIEATTASLTAYLQRGEGLHILMFSAADIDAAAARLTAAGVRHGGVNTVRRPVGTLVETVRYLEIEDPVGRIGLVAPLDQEIQATRSADHPNGALELVEVVLCVPDQELAATIRRFETYLGGAAAGLTVVPESGLATLLPGEERRGLISYAVTVENLEATRKLLEDNDLPVRRTPAGDLVVPSSAGLGTAIVFRA
jgi:catechol 2,3-dioxygenase-like lactoylglutathione lyase family enzyme